jgi:hypothetical protein
VIVSARELLRHKRYQVVHVLPGPIPEAETISGVNKNPNGNVYKRRDIDCGAAVIVPFHPLSILIAYLNTQVRVSR